MENYSKEVQPTFNSHIFLSRPFFMCHKNMSFKPLIPNVDDIETDNLLAGKQFLSVRDGFNPSN